MARQARAEVAAETLRILGDGFYDVAGSRVSLCDSLDAAVEQTKLLLSSDVVEVPIAGFQCRHETVFSVDNASTLSVARSLRALNPVALNFASAKNPGGGFIKGAQAQEESLARASGLYSCLKGNPMYTMGRQACGPDRFLYSNACIYSPGVPVFRDDSDRLLPDQEPISFITCAAPNAGMARKSGISEADLMTALRQRTGLVLRVAAAKGHETIVLGAFGCGVFENDPTTVARVFQDHLRGEFKGVFSRVHFAILGGKAGTLEAFQRVFGAGDGTRRHR